MVILKAHIKAHPKRMKSGKVSIWTEHERKIQPGLFDPETIQAAQTVNEPELIIENKEPVSPVIEAVATIADESADWQKSLAKRAYETGEDMPQNWVTEYEDGSDGMMPAGWYLIGLDKNGNAITKPERHEYGPFETETEASGYSKEVESAYSETDKQYDFFDINHSVIENVPEFLMSDENYIVEPRTGGGPDTIRLSERGVEEAYRMITEGRLALKIKHIKALSDLKAVGGVMNLKGMRPNDYTALNALDTPIVDVGQKLIALSLNNQMDEYYQLEDRTRLVIVNNRPDVTPHFKITSQGIQLLTVGNKMEQAMLQKKRRGLGL